MRKIPYRVRFPHMEDWDLVLRMNESRLVEFSNCPEPLYTYYLRAAVRKIKPELLDFNIYCRHCQERRRRGRPEIESVEAFRDYLRKHPLAGCKWLGLKGLIELKRHLS